MKRCPYCAEEIQDAAIVCRFCNRSLTTERVPGAATASPQPPTVIIQQPTWSPGIAAVLSLVIPGAGHMYKGEVGTGIVLLIVTIIGYAFLIIPGLIIHLCVILSAASGAPQQAGMVTCAECKHVGLLALGKCPQCGHVYGTPRGTPAVAPAVPTLPPLSPQEIAKRQRANRKFFVITGAVVAMLIVVAVIVNNADVARQQHETEARAAAAAARLVADRDPNVPHDIHCGDTMAHYVAPPRAGELATLALTLTGSAMPAVIEWAVADCIRMTRESLNIDPARFKGFRIEASKYRTDGRIVRVEVGHKAMDVSFYTTDNSLLWRKDNQVVFTSGK